MTIRPFRSGKINRLLDETDILCSAMSTDVRFKHPFNCIIAGPTGSGKSTFCVRFLQKNSSLCTETVLRGEFYGVSVNGPLFPIKSWTC